MRTLLAAIVVLLINSALDACVTVDLETGTYTVDGSGCVSDKYDE